MDRSAHLRPGHLWATEAVTAGRDTLIVLLESVGYRTLDLELVEEDGLL